MPLKDPVARKAYQIQHWKDNAERYRKQKRDRYRLLHPKQPPKPKTDWKLRLTKWCSRCLQDLPVISFGVNRKRYDGLTVYCSICQKEAHKSWRMKNPMKLKEHRERWISKDPDKYKRNEKAWQKRYRQSDKGFARNKRQHFARRSRKSTVNTLTAQDWRNILSHYDGRCVYCGSRDRITQDHYIPLSKGGSHDKDNVVPACLSCNLKKRSRHPHRLF